jgi:hypothetical protein
VAPAAARAAGALLGRRRAEGADRSKAVPAGRRVRPRRRRRLLRSGSVPVRRAASSPSCALTHRCRPQPARRPEPQLRGCGERPRSGARRGAASRVRSVLPRALRAVNLAALTRRAQAARLHARRPVRPSRAGFGAAAGARCRARVLLLPHRKHLQVARGHLSEPRHQEDSAASLLLVLQYLLLPPEGHGRQEPGRVPAVRLSRAPRPAVGASHACRFAPLQGCVAAGELEVRKRVAPAARPGRHARGPAAGRRSRRVRLV